MRKPKTRKRAAASVPHFSTPILLKISPNERSNEVEERVDGALALVEFVGACDAPKVALLPEYEDETVELDAAKTLAPSEASGGKGDKSAANDLAKSVMYCRRAAKLSLASS